MQPFPENSELQASASFWFKEGRELRVKVYKDLNEAVAKGPGLAARCEEESLLGTGTLVLRKGVFIDSEGMNRDPFKRNEKVVKWREEFNKIGQSMDD